MMVATEQADLFASDDQPNLFADDAPPVVYRADPAKVRLKLVAVHEEMKRASAMPWDGRTQRYHQTVFPQMTAGFPRRKRHSTASNSTRNGNGCRPRLERAS